MKSKENNVIEFKYIETPNYSYVMQVNGGYNCSADRFLFNGQKPEPTNKNKWFKISGRINKVERMKPDEQVNYRYELKSGYPESELCPKVIAERYLEDTKWEDVSGLYERKYDIIKGGLQIQDFKLVEVARRDSSFKFQDTSITIDDKKYKLSYALLDEIETHPDLLFEKPCRLNSKQMYKIVDKYLKDNVDNRYARVESGYSWRIKVDKRVKKARPYTTEHNANSHDKRRKPKWVKTRHEDTFINIIHFEDSSSCKKFPPEITGEDIFDLQNRLTQYLEGLVNMANEPYKECPHCNGYGVLKDDDSVIKE